jgi:hypothetical protein
MAKTMGIALRSVQRICQAHQLQPHRLRTLKRSRDPGFPAKRTDIVGLYVDPPAHAMVLSIDEKKPNPGPRPRPTRTADQAGALPDHDARLEASRHHHPDCRA